jgi:hypothetical protein
VAQVVDAQLRHVRFRAHVLEHAVRIARLDEAAVGGGEDQACFTPLRERIA